MRSSGLKFLNFEKKLHHRHAKWIEFQSFLLSMVPIILHTMQVKVSIPISTSRGSYALEQMLQGLLAHFYDWNSNAEVKTRTQHIRKTRTEDLSVREKALN